MKNILFATSEAVPFIKTGGLADVAGSLPKYFDKRYFDIRVILPKYACMKQEWKDKMNYITHFYMDLGYKNCYVGIMHMEYEGIQFYFIDNEYYFSGPNRMMEEHGIWRNLHSSPKLYCQFFRLSDSDRILYTVMTGRPDLFPYICTTASSRMNFSGISRRS